MFLVPLGCYEFEDEHENEDEDERAAPRKKKSLLCQFRISGGFQSYLTKQISAGAAQGPVFRTRVNLICERGQRVVPDSGFGVNRGNRSRRGGSQFLFQIRRRFDALDDAARNQIFGSIVGI